MLFSMCLEGARRAIATVAFVMLCGPVAALAGDSQFIVRGERHPAERRIFAVLEEPTEIMFIEQPLSEVMLYLKDRHGIGVVADEPALEDAGIDTDQPITIDVSDVSLGSALRIMLGKYDLTYSVHNEVLMITTELHEQMRSITRVYSVADLVQDSSAEELADVLRAMRGDTSSAGQIVAFQQLLLVRDTDAAHRELVKLLSLMREQLGVEIAGRPARK